MILSEKNKYNIKEKQNKIDNKQKYKNLELNDWYR